jgi:hypothetical protein
MVLEELRLLFVRMVAYGRDAQPSDVAEGKRVHAIVI